MAIVRRAFLLEIFRRSSSLWQWKQGGPLFSSFLRGILTCGTGKRGAAAAGGVVLGLEQITVLKTVVVGVLNCYNLSCIEERESEFSCGCLSVCSGG